MKRFLVSLKFKIKINYQKVDQFNLSLIVYYQQLPVDYQLLDDFQQLSVDFSIQNQLCDTQIMLYVVIKWEQTWFNDKYYFIAYK